MFHLKRNILNSFSLLNWEFKNRNCSSHHYFPLTQKSSLYTICWEIVLRNDLKVREVQDDFFFFSRMTFEIQETNITIPGCIYFLKLFIYLFIYLAALRLSHDRRDLLVAVHGIYCPDQVKLGPLHQSVESQPLDHQRQFLCLLFNINTSLKNLFLFFVLFLFSNPCVQDWLSIDHSKGAALLRMKPQPRSRSSTNGLAPGSPQTCGGDGRGGGRLSGHAPCLRTKGFLHQTRS